MMAEEKVVLYADILGFAALTESCPIDIDGLRSKDRLSAFSDNIDALVAAQRNPLTAVFSGFHYSLGWILRMARMIHPVTAITFSDSVFVATTYAFEAVKIAVDLIHSMLPQKIPVRIGIAHGSFTALRFMSDISADSGDHAAQFLGTSIVRAHAAETCGIKGFRILLHPSFLPLTDDVRHNPKGTQQGGSRSLNLIRCTEQECGNPAGVTHEVNYWNLRHSKESEAWRGLQDMWNRAPETEAQHYLSTAEAIDRMRIAHGQEPLGKLRRRTLPRAAPNTGALRLR